MEDGNPHPRRSSEGESQDGLGWWQEGLSPPDRKGRSARNRGQQKFHGTLYYFLWYIYLGALVSFSGLVFFTIGFGWPLLQDYIADLPDDGLLDDYRPDLGSVLLAGDGSVVAEFFEEKRRLARFEDLPSNLVQALIATEDQRFYDHQGLNPFRIALAFKNNLTTGSMQGGSTLTQQLAKDLYTGGERTYQRKIKEALYALKLEQELSKEEILAIYFNQVGFGHRTRGIAAAAEHYFGRVPSEITLAQSATLVGLLKATTRYSPISHPERSQERRKVVLRAMATEGFITQEELEQASTEDLALGKKSSSGARQKNSYPYWTSFFSENLLTGEGFRGKNPPTNDPPDLLDREQINSKGLKIKTTLNPTLQDWADESIRKALIEQEGRRRKNHPGWGLKPEEYPKFSAKIKPKAKLLGIVTGKVEPNWLTVKLVDIQGTPEVAVPRAPEDDWRTEFGVLGKDFYVQLRAYEREASGKGNRASVPEQDLINRGLVSEQDYAFRLTDQHLDQHAQGAIVCLEVGTGRILAWSGGFDWYSEPSLRQRIRCVERTQPGSSFKPIIFARALEQGYTPSHQISNEPYYKELLNGKVWAPKNYTGKTGGHKPLREVLIQSLNIPTVRVFETLIGKSYDYDPLSGGHTLEIARRLGIRSPIPKEMSVALGTAEVTPLEMATAYSVFANSGALVEPYAIESIETRDGQVAYSHRPSGNPTALDPMVSFLLTDILTGVIRKSSGTAYRRAHDFPFPIAGKTGTTNRYFDAWFVGYSKNLVTAVWIGHDRRTSLGNRRSGGAVALQPWLEFMGKAIPYHLDEYLGYTAEEIEASTETLTSADNMFAFDPPPGGLQKVKICRASSGRVNAFCDKTMYIWVKEGEYLGVCRDCGLRYEDDLPVSLPPPPGYPPRLSADTLPPPAQVRLRDGTPIIPPTPRPRGPSVEIRDAESLGRLAPAYRESAPPPERPPRPRRNTRRLETPPEEPPSIRPKRERSLR